MNWLPFTVLIAAALPGFAQENVVLNYRGRLRAESTAFSGTGWFMFGLEDKNGEIFWSSGDFPFAGSTNNPANALKVSVQQGAYAVRLGEKPSNMPPLNFAGLRRVQNPRLKIWFNDGWHGWQRAGEDVPLDNLMASLGDAGRRPITSAQGDAIVQELREVRALLQRQNQPSAPTPAPPAFATVGLEGPTLGRTDAPLVMVEFTDYQCPFCKQFHENVLPELVKKYVETGKLRIVSRNLALPFHANAEPAARAALCANEQQKYWTMREKLFASSSDLTATNIFAAAEAASLDRAKFRSCLEAKTFETVVKKDGQEANAAGISGTPSFVLGKPAGDKVNGMVIIGAQPVAAFDTEIQKLLGTGK
jgi:protein-disulfide isomerase